jgi:hypothetical protein
MIFARLKITIPTQTQNIEAPKYTLLKLEEELVLMFCFGSCRGGLPARLLFCRMP